MSKYVKGHDENNGWNWCMSNTSVFMATIMKPAYMIYNNQNNNNYVRSTSLLKKLHVFA